jgi:hypothetical protein
VWPRPDVRESVGTTSVGRKGWGTAAASSDNAHHASAFQPGPTWLCVAVFWLSFDTFTALKK